MFLIKNNILASSVKSLIALFAILSLLSTASAVRCYKCGDDIGACPEDEIGELANNNSKYIVNCVGRVSACVLKYKVEKGNHDRAVSSFCGSQYFSTPCVSVPHRPNVKFCYRVCQDDLCNGPVDFSSSSKRAFAWLLLVAATSLVSMLHSKLWEHNC